MSKAITPAPRKSFAPSSPRLRVVGEFPTPAPPAPDLKAGRCGGIRLGDWRIGVYHWTAEEWAALPEDRRPEQHWPCNCGYGSCRGRYGAVVDPD